MVEIADRATVGRASVSDAGALRPLASIPLGQWRALAERALEPNGYYLPSWELAVDALASGRTGASALVAQSSATPDGANRLIGLMPVVSMARAYKIPLPALVSAHPYGTLCTPPLDHDMAQEAATDLLQAAQQSGAHALILREISLDGATMKTLREVMLQDGLHPRVLQSQLRASLDAAQEPEELLREALGHKKLKELRRQRHRLAEHGVVRFDVARTREQVAAALEIFLKLEARGWKGKRGTALIQDDGDAGFIRRATPALAETGQCEIVTLYAGDAPVAAGIVLRHQDRAFFFKLGIDERFAKSSPGVQLTLELTRHLCADPAIATADSTASADHPMINPIWRGRFAVGDVLIPLRKHDPVVPMIYGAMMLRSGVRELARRTVHLMRGSKA